ncbi:MAG: aminotransferase class III-fold pyridoxal phosphate-dependent enzyme [Nitrospirae bacterium]|nr:aminotransferase class III-fold pyridoxal phosphate-dependent enzyme [Nitrospirota bacterium]
MSERYQHSEEFLERALKIIPLGTQTFSKSKTQYPFGVSPYYLSRGFGSHVWDVDGNEYVDFINALAAVTLGYNDPEVDGAVREQLEAGVIFSLPHPVEIEVAEKIIEMVPCAEMVRFGKNGSDATAGAIRIARAYTGKDHVAVCGYHGWQDWYIGSTTKNKGVPKATQELTHVFNYNDIESLHSIFRKLPEQIAAVIMEPMNVVEPTPGFLEEVKKIAHKHGAVFIFDETVTGFRFSEGGAQKYFQVIPDIATFGKGVANGYPLSVVAGKFEIMRYMEEVFFSFTFGGEALSLAAARATMKKLQRNQVVEILKKQGEKIIKGLKELINKNDIGHIVSISGHPSWSFLLFKDVTPYSQWEIKTLFLQEMFSRGILTLGTHNMSYAHSDEDISFLLRVYSDVLPVLKDAVNNRVMDKLLRCKPLEPLFKIR